jgi:hypothetical protein
MIELETLREEVYRKFGKSLAIDMNLDTLYALYLKSNGKFTTEDMFELLGEVAESQKGN